MSIPATAAGRRRHRLHYLSEWAALRRLRQTDLVRAMGVHKGTMSKWFAGELPSEGNIAILACLLAIEPGALFRHPDEDWISRFFAERSAAERQRAMTLLEAAFPKPDA